MRGVPPKNQNCLLEGGPLVVQASPTSCVLGTYLYPCTSWRCCERLRSASVNFFWRLFHCICPFHDGWFTSASALTMLSVQQFLTQNSMTPVPHPLYSHDLALIDFSLFPRRKKFSQKLFSAETRKGIKIDKVKNCFK